MSRPPVEQNAQQSSFPVKPMTSYAPISESMDAKAREASKKKVEKSFEQTKNSVGLLVTEELESAIARCKALVESIAASCRAENQKFIDDEFDLSAQREACLWGLNRPKMWEKHYNPADVIRVGEIYDAPVFFEDGATGNDIKQGKLENCWFLSALAVVATVPGLMEKICVHRDEFVGIYGFIFFRDGEWVDVIVDDQLFVKFGSYEGIGAGGKAAFPHDQELYDTLRRRGSDVLYYAKSMSNNETWVPLVEKAYAKFYGNYSYLSFGFTMHAMEDLTGGVCRRMNLTDVIDKDRLWHEISTGIDHSRLFGCGSIQAPDHKTIHNLGSRHAYAILRTGEYNGKHFLVVRNPWGNDSEWSGRWSDNSKEWTDEWQPALAMLNHSFGADGQFVMEYSDFLRNWPMLDVTRLFDTSWVSSSIWVHLPGMTEGQVPTWGDVSFTITVPEHTESIIALQEVESRSFKELSGFLKYDLAFVVFKKGSTKEIATSERCLRMISRSQRVEIPLDEGEYVVHVRIRSKRVRKPDYIAEGKKKWNPEIFRKLCDRRTEAYSKALNYPHHWRSEALSTTLESLSGYDIRELELKAGKAKQEKAEGVGRPQELPTSGIEADRPPTTRTEASLGGTNTIMRNSEVPADNLADLADQETSEYEDQEPTEGGSTKLPNTAEAALTTATTADSQATEKPPPQVIGHNASCNLCGMDPITGPLFHCIDDACPDFDTCLACFDKKEHDQMHEMIVVSTPIQIVHEQACSTCKVSPIVGTLYVCTEEGCRSLISCQKCFSKGHNPKHLIGIVREVIVEADEPTPERPVHVGITCNRCGMDPIVGTRHKCMHEQCPAYNLCENCVGKAIHDASMHDVSHPVLPLKTREEAESLPGLSDGSPLVLGLRVYTKKSAKVTLKAQLKHGSLAHSSN